MRDLKVFDAWALLTWLLNQPAAVQVEALLQKADQGEQEIVMSWINVGEVYYYYWIIKYGSDSLRETGRILKRYDAENG